MHYIKELQSNGRAGKGKKVLYFWLFDWYSVMAVRKEKKLSDNESYCITLILKKNPEDESFFRGDNLMENFPRVSLEI